MEITDEQPHNDQPRWQWHTIYTGAWQWLIS